MTSRTEPEDEWTRLNKIIDGLRIDLFTVKQDRDALRHELVAQAEAAERAMRAAASANGEHAELRRRAADAESENEELRDAVVTLTLQLQRKEVA